MGYPTISIPNSANGDTLIVWRANSEWGTRVTRPSDQAQRSGEVASICVGDGVPAFRAGIRGVALSHQGDARISHAKEEFMRKYALPTVFASGMLATALSLPNQANAL